MNRTLNDVETRWNFKNANWLKFNLKKSEIVNMKDELAIVHQKSKFGLLLTEANQICDLKTRSHMRI